MFRTLQFLKYIFIIFRPFKSFLMDIIMAGKIRQFYNFKKF